MILQIYKNTKVFIVAPANSATGGPELLHQLAYNLREYLKIEVYMYYHPSNIFSEPIHREYKLYKIPFVDRVPDEQSNILIVSEFYPYVKMLGNFKNIRKVIWWLSVDSFYLSKFCTPEKKFFFINKLSKILFKHAIYDDIQSLIQNKKGKLVSVIRNDPFARQANLHLVQSEYAKVHLLKAGINKDAVCYMSDYLNEFFLKETFKIEKKEDVVVYNPAKGYNFTRKIMKYIPDIKFIPLVNMTREQVIEILKKAKIYIDFGNHPGKDRLPRETAILGCCVITGKKGSAAYSEDVPISEEYKFDDKKENIPRIKEKIRDCIKNYYEKYKDFDEYRKTIKKEPERFMEDMKKIFIRVE